MATITTRSGKGSPLTNTEVDNNFTNLNTDKVEKSGDTLTGDLSFGDDVKAKFGASGDLRIYHDGSNSYVSDQGTGNLKVLASTVQIMNALGDENALVVRQNAEVELYHNGSEKLATTSTGIDVTGTVTADGFLGGTNVLRINSLEGSRGSIQISAPHLGTREVTYGNNFYLASDGTYTQDSAVIGGGLLQITAPNSDFGEFLFKSKQDPDTGGAVRDRLKIDSDGDISFYDDAGTSQDLYWDASTSRLGLGTTSPSSDIHIAKSSSVIRMEDTDNNSYGMILYNTASGGLLLRSDHNQLTGTSGSNIIFQTEGSEAMRIDSNGRLGIGTTSPSDEFHVRNGNHPRIRIDATNTGQNANLLFINSTDGLYAQIENEGSGLKFLTQATERMRIDSSGNLLVGKTSASSATVGQELKSSGVAIFTQSANPPIITNRLSTDGEIINFRKDGSTVGSIGVQFSDNLYISGDSNHAGLAFGTNLIYPSDTSGSTADNEFDLGFSTGRFKDLYLSGGVYLGGTGSANLLDDYEEGTFTSSFSDGTNTATLSTASYTKIGQLVQVLISGYNVNTSGLSGSINISNLPFATSGETGGTLYYRDGTTAGTGYAYYISSGSTTIGIRKNGGPSATATNVSATSNASVFLSITYKTAS